MYTQEAKEIFKEMERIGESKCFTDEERNMLQPLFKAGTLSKDICWVGWTRYTDENGNPHYTDSFSTEMLNLMYKLSRKRIEKAKERSEAFYNDFTLEKCADFVNKEIQAIRQMDTHFTEDERLKDSAMNSTASVENGKIVIREKGGFIGTIKIWKTYDGYRLEDFVPLAGTGVYGSIPKDEIFRILKQVTRYELS